jgi:hypothetical protein
MGSVVPWRWPQLVSPLPHAGRAEGIVIGRWAAGLMRRVWLWLRADDDSAIVANPPRR